jgi:hypothetical protein
VHDAHELIHRAIAAGVDFVQQTRDLRLVLHSQYASRELPSTVNGATPG